MSARSDNQPTSGAVEPAAPLITVAICTRNRSGFLRQAVESVTRQITADTEILVVDNASTDDTPAVAQALAGRHPGLTVVREEELGLSAARNTALRCAGGVFVLFLDDDAVAEPGWLAVYRDLALHPPVSNLAAIGGAVFPRYDGPTPRWLHPQANTFHWSDQPQEFPGRSLPWGGNLALRRDLALAIGGFNPALGRKGRGMGAYEESDLLDRLKAQGGRLWWAPGARILHHVARDRLTFRASCWTQFSQGRSNAIYRFGSTTRTSWLYRFSRAVLAPFHCLLHVAAGGFTLLTGNLVRAAGHLFRAAHTAGLGLELALGLFSPQPVVEE